jgi:type IV pilus assembly protein PilB
MAKPALNKHPVLLRSVLSRKSSLKATIKDQSGVGKTSIGELLCKEGHIIISQLKDALDYRKKYQGRLKPWILNMNNYVFFR